MRDLIDLVESYQHGWCGPLALALHDRLGWETVGIFDEMFDTKPRHVGVISPEGLYGDHRGLTMSADEFLTPWSPEGEIKPWTPDQIRAQFTRPPEVHAECGEIADRLVASR